MAIVASVPKLSTLQIIYGTGIDEAGRATTKTRSFSNIKNTVTDQDLYDVTLAIVGLQQNDFVRATVIDKTELETGY